MKHKKYYRLWSELISEYPELSKSENYFALIEKGQEVKLGDIIFGKTDDPNSYMQYYTEKKEIYGFDAKTYNVYNDLISEEIREYIPNMVIRSIRNAHSDFRKQDGEYVVKYEYLPLQNKRVSDSKLFDDQIKTVEFKIGDWLLIENDKNVYDKTILDLPKKYNADYNSFLIVGEKLLYYWNLVLEAQRNYKSPANVVRSILTEMRDYFFEKLIVPFKSAESPKEISNQIELVTELLTLPIITHFKTTLDYWKIGEAYFENKDEAKYFVKLVNNQNIKKSLAESIMKNPLSKYATGGKLY